MAYKNKEKQKVWLEANKEKKAAYDKVYRKAYEDSLKDGLFTVYLIVNENYVGMTSFLKKRLIKHKSLSDKDVSDVKILGKYKTKREALDVEAGYHKLGYNGKRIYK